MVDRVTIDRQALDVWQEKNLEYLRYEYDLKSSDLVIDAGSYQGEFKSKIIEKFGCTVIEYDPLVNCALWIENGTIKTGGAFYYTSMFEEGQNSYPCVDVVEELRLIENIGLMKINIEGAEVAVINRMLDFDLIKRIKYLQVQFHYVQGQDSRGDYQKIAERLKSTHELQWRYGFVWESWKRK